MPICRVTISDILWDLNTVENCDVIREVVADKMDSKSRRLDKDHITLSVLNASRECMLADIEIDVIAQFYLRRFFTRDKRAHAISRAISERFGVDCASWINLCWVGYSRHTSDGKDFYSIPEDNKVVMQKRKELQG